MKNLLKRLLGKRDGNMGRAEGTPQADRTVVEAPRATSLPRVQEVVSGDWQNVRKSHGRSRMASPGSVSVAGRAVAEAREYLKAGQKGAAQRCLQRVRANELMVNQLEKKRWVIEQLLLTRLEFLEQALVKLNPSVSSVALAEYEQ